jgi:hypothetical protein
MEKALQRWRYVFSGQNLLLCSRLRKWIYTNEKLIPAREDRQPNLLLAYAPPVNLIQHAVPVVKLTIPHRRMNDA